MSTFMGLIERVSNTNNNEIMRQLVDIVGIERIKGKGVTHKYFVVSGVKVVYIGWINDAFHYKVYEATIHDEVILDFSLGTHIMFYNREHKIDLGYQGIHTENDFHKWASRYCEPKDIYVEIEDNLFIHIYNNGYCKEHLSLLAFSKAKLLSICEELGIEKRDF